jgi:hypothetical protein
VASINHKNDGHGYSLTNKVPTFRHHCLSHVLSVANEGTINGDTEVWGGQSHFLRLFVCLFVCCDVLRSNILRVQLFYICSAVYSPSTSVVGVVLQKLTATATAPYYVYV